MSTRPKQQFLKVIACEIAAREIYFEAARSPHLVDLEFLNQGYHDTPTTGREEVQRRIDAVPQGKYDAILLGYGLCSNILTGLQAVHTPLVIPRAHDCITFFLGSKERYQECFTARPGTYYYSSGWLECARRRGEKGPVWGGASLPASVNQQFNLKGSYDEWVRKYGEDQAKYLLEEMSRWTQSYTHGSLISYDFLKHLGLEDQVRKICAERGWDYEEIQGDMGLFQRLLSGRWDDSDFLVVQPGHKVIVTFDAKIIDAAPVA